MDSYLNRTLNKGF